MESLPVRRKSCLLRIRENCPFRKLRRQTYDVSAANSSPIGSYCNNIGPPTSNQPISTVYSQPLPPPSRCSPDQSEAVADVHMEEENQQNPESRAEDCMDLDDDVDPETGERAQGWSPPPTVSGGHLWMIRPRLNEIKLLLLFCNTEKQETAPAQVFILKGQFPFFYPQKVVCWDFKLCLQVIKLLRVRWW